MIFWKNIDDNFVNMLRSDLDSRTRIWISQSNYKIAGSEADKIDQRKCYRVKKNALSYNVPDLYSLNPDPDPAINLIPDPEDPWIRIQAIS